MNEFLHTSVTISKKRTVTKSPEPRKKKLVYRFEPRAKNTIFSGM